MPVRPSLWFRAVSLVALVFILTVLIMLAALFTDPQSAINQWLNRYGLLLLLAEVVLLIVLGIVAMARDGTRN